MIQMHSSKPIVRSNIALLVDGPNMRSHSYEINVPFSEVIDTIWRTAESYGNIIEAVAYFGIKVRETPAIIKYAIERGFDVLIGSASRETLDIDEKLIAEAENYIKRNDIDILALASGDEHYLPLSKSAREHNKKLLLIYPPEHTSRELLEASDMVAEIKFPNCTISPAARPCSQSCHP